MCECPKNMQSFFVKTPGGGKLIYVNSYQPLSARLGLAQPSPAWLRSARAISGHPGLARLGSAGLSWPSSARLVSALLRHWPAQARFLVVKTNKNTDFCKNYGGGKFKLRRRKIQVWAWLGSTWARFGSARPALAARLSSARLGSAWHGNLNFPENYGNPILIGHSHIGALWGGFESLSA